MKAVWTAPTAMCRPTKHQTLRETYSTQSITSSHLYDIFKTGTRHPFTDTKTGPHCNTVVSRFPWELLPEHPYPRPWISKSPDAQVPYSRPTYPRILYLRFTHPQIRPGTCKYILICPGGMNSQAFPRKPALCSYDAEKNL